MPTKKQLQDQLDEIKNEIECVKEGLDIAEQEYMIPMLPASAGGVLPTPDGIDEETFSACQGCRTSRFMDFHRGVVTVMCPKAAENEKIKEIYEWNDEMDTDFIDSVKEREEIFKKYYDCPDIKEKYEELEKENEKLKIDMINHTTQNYSEWKKEQETLAIGLVREDLKRAEEENEKLKEENEKLDKEKIKIQKAIDYLNTSEAWCEELQDIKEENEKLKEDIDERSKLSQEGVKRMIRLSGLGYDITKCRQVNMNLMEKVIMEKIEELRKQIPKKPRKCLSQKDKEVLEEILHNIENHGTAEYHNDGGGWFYEAKVNLLKRLLK